MAFLTNTKSSLDTNAADAVTASLDITAQSSFSWCVVAATGAHVNHVVVLQVSLDNSTFIDASSKLMGAGVISQEHDITVGYVRWKVLIAEGATSTVDIIINAK